jgi:DNA ligase-1
MKPMLAGKADLKELHFPVMVSPKFDGVRALVVVSRVIGRSFGACVLVLRNLKPIPNLKVQELFSRLPEGFDGELIDGDPTAPDAYRKTVSRVFSHYWSSFCNIFNILFAYSTGFVGFTGTCNQ